MTEKKQPKPQVSPRTKAAATKGAAAKKPKKRAAPRVTTAVLADRIDRLADAVEQVAQTLTPQLRSNDVAAEEHALLNLLDSIVDRRTEGMLLPLTRLAVQLDRAAAAEEREEAARLVAESKEQLEELLEALGLERIEPAQGDEFRPLLHEGVRDVAPGELEEGTVAEVIRPGYRIRDGKVLLPARVAVVAWSAS